VPRQPRCTPLWSDSFLMSVDQCRQLPGSLAAAAAAAHPALLRSRHSSPSRPAPQHSPMQPQCNPNATPTHPQRTPNAPPTRPRCATDGSKRAVDKSGMPGITLYTSLSGATDFKAACLPVLIKVLAALRAAVGWCWGGAAEGRGSVCVLGGWKGLLRKRGAPFLEHRRAICQPELCTLTSTLHAPAAFTPAHLTPAPSINPPPHPNPPRNTAARGL